MRVPVLVEGVELRELVAAVLKPDRLGELRRDAVLVPGDIPRDRDHDLAADAGERADARLGLAEALRDPGNRAPEIGLVEEIGRLDDLALGLGQSPKERLVGDGSLGHGGLPRLEQAREAEAASLPLSRDRRRGRAPLLQPAVLERDVPRNLLIPRKAHVIVATTSR